MLTCAGRQRRAAARRQKSVPHCSSATCLKRASRARAQLLAGAEQVAELRCEQVRADECEHVGRQVLQQGSTSYAVRATRVAGVLRLFFGHIVAR